MGVPGNCAVSERRRHCAAMSCEGAAQRMTRGAGDEVSEATATPQLPASSTSQAAVAGSDAEITIVVPAGKVGRSELFDAP